MAPLDFLGPRGAIQSRVKYSQFQRLKVLFPLILYTQISPAVAPVLLRLGQIGIRQIVIARHDDHPARLGELLSGEASHAVAGQLMNALSDLLVGCPGELKWAIETAIR